MSRSSENRKCTKKSKVDESEEKDRISSLPDDVLSNILSLMPTKYAFRTSLLSTRWKSLWTSATTIDFDWYPMGMKKVAYSDFMDFVDRVLLLHKDPNINRFRLSCRYGYCKPYRLDSWICTATKLNVQELDLAFNLIFDYELPRSLLTSINLVNLKISGDVFLRFPMPVFLPSLKVLHLCMFGRLGENSFKNFLSGCPILEELDFMTSPMGGIETLFICSSTLKKLDLSVSSLIRNHWYGVVIKAPALEFLRIKDYVMPFHIELPSRVKAELDFSVPIGGYEDDPHNMVDAWMLAKIPNVEQLRLTGLTLEVVIQASAYELLFPNLTNLQIDLKRGIPWATITELLGHMPNLKIFVLNKVNFECHISSGQATSHDRPKCLSLFLEKFVFRGFDGCEAELKLLRYLLENAMVLKKLSLTSRFMNKRILGQILKFPRGSNKCEIELL